MATESVMVDELEPDVEKQRDTLASAIGDALVKAGMIEPQPLTGLQLLFYLDQLVEHYIAMRSELTAAN